MSNNKPGRVYLSSYYRRAQDSANSFTLSLPSQIINPKILSINSCVIPYLWYNFGSTERILYYQLSAPQLTRIWTITLNTAKVYTTTADFITDLNAAFVLNHGANVVTAAIGTDGRITLTCNATSIYVIGIGNREYNWNSTYFDNCANRLGFYNAKTVAATSAGQFSAVFKGSGSLQLIRTTGIFVCIDCIAGDSFTSNSAEQTVSTVMFHLPVINATFGGLNYYTNQDYLLFRARELPYTIFNISVRLLDDNFDDLDGLLDSAKVLLELSFSYKGEGDEEKT